ncbi:MAG: hypothetical protein JSW61_07995 [Candidatus Thorarchaeota archaeon]|nr:MAG: hypothetical protein JSW61_07995 [Candidatus Thorarchaeota archaeon]
MPIPRPLNGSRMMQEEREESKRKKAVMKIKGAVRAFDDHCLWRTRLDFLCDECNGRMRPGGHFKTKIGTREYQFCKEECMEAYVAKHGQAN